MNDLVPDLQKIGDVVSREIQEYIEAGKVKGKPLKYGTLKRKRPETRKLYHGGDLAESAKVNVNTDGSVDIGYTTKKHNSKTSSQPIELSSLAEIHNEGNDINPKRPFLFDNDEWLKEYQRAAQKEYERQLKAKGIL